MNMESSNKPARKNLRLRSYDYSAAGFYFVTICTHGRRCLFGEVNNDAMQLNQSGCYIADQWLRLPNSYSSVVLHEFVVMPNHLHGIVEILKGNLSLSEGAIHCALWNCCANSGRSDPQLQSPMFDCAKQ
jgi:hypothetical protein